MNALVLFAERHWLSIVLIAGVLVSIYLVYKERSKIMINEDK